MKFVINRVFILCFLFICSYSITSRKSTFLGLSKQDDLNKIWSELFTKPQGSNCKQQDYINNPYQNVINTIIVDNSGIPWSGPKKKPNVLDKQQGFGSSAYFFDYIDSILQADIVKEFETVYNAVKELKPDEKDWIEPYPVEKLIGVYSGNLSLTNQTQDPNDQTIINKIKDMAGNNEKIFNENAYKAGITVSNIHKACKDFKWSFNSADKNYAKKIVDIYDFDGDGRLNPREFIIMTIHNNRNILGGDCTNCYKDIISRKIEPMFRFIDCNNDNKVNSDDLWDSFKSLKRPNSGSYDFYNCYIKNKPYRTSAINDFILKNHNSFNGLLTKEEFIMGILMGYWDRQTDEVKIYPDDSKNLKTLRWGKTGDVDAQCEKIKNISNNPK